MISQKMVDLLNKQVNAELYSFHLYLSMSAYFESINLRGFSHWMEIQGQEELEHARKISRHIVDRMGRARTMAIEEPPFEWSSALDAMKKAFEHEVKVTGLLNELVNLAIAEKDHATFNMLQWFVAEQIEEEKSADEIVRRLEMVRDERVGLTVIDSELAQRKSK